MPTHKSNWKRLRQDKERRLRNISRKSQIRSQVNRLKAAASAGAGEETLDKEFRAAASLLDRAAKTGVIHKRKADRRKSRLAKLAPRSQTSQS